jgi:tRNA nucleotidyltransferase/poly(A) polymerase
LTREEEELFCLLRTAAAECGMSSSTLRVAGGWVRDKILASGGFDRVAPDPPPGGGVASDSSDLLRWSHSSHSPSGGAALSLLSGTVPVDIDIALDDRLGREFADVLSRWLRSNDIVRRADVGVVQKNPEKSRHLGTASMRLGRYWIDFANLRAGETYAHGSRIPESTRAGTPREDAHRRDLTINSLFYNINEGAIEDMTGRGLDDLRGGVISTPLPPLTTLLDDPLRALRAVRFASRLGFGMSDDLRGAVADFRVREALERKVSRERIGDEVDLMLRGRDPVGALGLLVGLGLAGKVFPQAQPPVPPPPSSTTSSSSPHSPRGVVVVGGCVHREGLALLAAAHGRLCDNGASPPGWCDARRARRAGAVNGVGGEGCGQALVLADDEDARRMLWYAAFLKPLRDRCAVASAADGGRRDDDEDEDDAGGGGAGPIPQTTKKANRSAVSVLLVDELKRPARDAEAVERIMKAADGFTGLVSRGGDVSALPVLLSGARVFRAAASGKDDYDDDEIPAGGGDRREGGEGGGGGRVLCTMDNRLVDPDTEDDPVWRHNMEFRTNCAEILRDVGQLWRAAFVLSMCEQLVRCKDHEVEYTCGGELVSSSPTRSCATSVLFPPSCSPFIAHIVSSASSPFPPRAPPTGPRGPGGGRHRHRGKLQRLCRGHDATRPDRDMESEAAARRGRDRRGRDGAAERAQGAGVPPRHGGADSVAHEPPRR